MGAFARFFHNYRNATTITPPSNPMNQIPYLLMAPDEIEQLRTHRIAQLDACAEWNEREGHYTTRPRDKERYNNNAERCRHGIFLLTR